MSPPAVTAADRERATQALTFADRPANHPKCSLHTRRIQIEKWLKLAERIPGPSTETITAAAREANAYVLFPMYEKEQDGEH